VDTVSIEALTEDLRDTVDRRSDPGRLAIVLRQEGGTLIGVIDTATDYDDARPLAIDAAFSQRARIALCDPDALIHASWDPSTLPLAPLDRQTTVTLGQVSIRVTRGADMTDWVALLGFDVDSVHGYLGFWPLTGGATEIQPRRALTAGAYLLKARKRVSTLTPIRPRRRVRQRVLVGAAEPTNKVQP